MNDPNVNETENASTDSAETERPRLVIEVPTEVKAGMRARGGSCLVCTCDGGGCCSACP